MEDELFGKILLVSPHNPSNSCVHKTILVSTHIDALHQRQPEIPFDVWVKEGSDEASTRSVNVNGNVPPGRN